MTTRLWDVATAEELARLEGHLDSVYALDFSHDGKRLATSSQDGTVLVYALDIHQLLAIARQRVTRGLNPDECRNFFRNQTCPDLR